MFLVLTSAVDILYILDIFHRSSRVDFTLGEDIRR